MYIFDIEANGLLEDATKIHCLVVRDRKTMKSYKFTPENIDEGIHFLVEKNHKGHTIIGHNIIAYDIPLIEKLYKVKFKKQFVRDTLVMARLVFSAIGDIDANLIRDGILPKALYGSHSLKAYGYRLDVLKGTYAEDKEEAWACFTPEMLDYCEQDIYVTEALYKSLLERGYTEKSMQLEHDCQFLMVQQEHNGYPFDVEKALALKDVLEEREKEIRDELLSYAPKIPDKVFVPKKDNASKGYKKGVPIQRYKDFNPNSRDHLHYMLEHTYGYTFSDSRMYTSSHIEEETTTKKLQLNEETLSYILEDSTISDELRHIIELYMEYFMVNKRLGQLATGENAWLKLVKADGRIHGRCNPNGAVSGRATHSRPNLSQVPAVNVPYGSECRELFTVPNGWYQVGIDCSGLELRCLAHYLYPYDDGEYANEVLNGDIHTKNQESAGLATRSDAKRFIYGFLYGAGNAKIGEIVGGDADAGARLKRKFLKNTPQIRKLQSDIKETLAPFDPLSRSRAWKRKYLIGLDGRKLYVRSLHSALNLLLQSCGALICKKWICRTDERLKERGFIHHTDGDYFYMVWSHDEIQVACRTKGIAEVVIEEAQKAIRDTQEFFKIRIQLDTEGKIGKNWKDCH